MLPNLCLQDKASQKTTTVLVSCKTKYKMHKFLSWNLEIPPTKYKKIRLGYLLDSKAVIVHSQFSAFNYCLFGFFLWLKFFFYYYLICFRVSLHKKYLFVRRLGRLKVRKSYCETVVLYVYFQVISRPIFEYAAEIL